MDLSPAFPLTLRRALLASLACHGVLLLWGDVRQLAVLSSLPGGNRSLQARLQAPGVGINKGEAPGRALRAGPGAVLQRGPEPSSPAVPEQQGPVVTRDSPPVLAVSGASHEAMPAPRMTGGRVVMANGGASAGTAPAAATAAGGGGEASAVPAALPAREGASGDALRQYRLALALEARRFKRYPRLARERAWEGTVEVAVRLGSGPALASLEHSSGYGLLDDQGLEMVRQALAVTPVPEALRGREWRLVFPIQFSLEE